MMRNNDLNIKVNKKYLNIYHILADGSDCCEEDGYASSFVLCAFLGFKEFQASGALADDFEGVTLLDFSQLSDYQQTILKAIAIKTNGYPILQNEPELIALTERLADRGMEVLIDRVLKEWVQESTSGEYFLERNADRQMEENLAIFIRNQLVNNSLL